MSVVLEVENLSKSFRRRRREPPIVAVDQVSFVLERGETLALVGESGAGKSTTGRMLLRLIEPDSGSVRIEGVEMLGLSRSELRAHRRHMQMIFQDPFNSLDPRMTVGRSVAEPMKLHLGLNKSDRETRSVELLRRVGLGDHLLHRYPQEMSGGQLQRVAIARAISLEPKLLVCDEPVAALDVSVRAQVLNLLLDLQDEHELSFVFVTHDLSTIEVFADQIMVMREGRTVEYGAVSDVFAAPNSPYTRELLDAIPELVPRSRRPESFGPGVNGPGEGVDVDGNRS